jgi:S-adenosylmethionine:tRNA ribosyltransferase-isomerase
MLISDYNYPLPPGLIAQHPLADRDGSRLLVMRNGSISGDVFRNIGNHLPPGSLLVFNDTRVIRARLIFRKTSGASIEIFLIEPLAPESELQQAFLQRKQATWKCLVGNVKRWKEGLLRKEVQHSNSGLVTLMAALDGPLEDGCFSVTFTWDPPEKSFAEMVSLAGLVPLPPYITRDTDDDDTLRYQTIYAENDGSVAAPTAGLHFTDQLMKSLEKLGIGFAKVTLHVGIGTFRPVTRPEVKDHLMHSEKIVVTRETLQRLLKHGDNPVIAVGTTAARTLESLYWAGTKLIGSEYSGPVTVEQWDPYAPDQQSGISVAEAIEAILHFLDLNHLPAYTGETHLMIIPGYRYRLVSALITNFHMPQSTLLLLVAALVGDQWKAAYDFALREQFRFLSYGDSCLFFKR